MSRSFSRGAVSIISALTVFCFPGGHDKAHAFEFDDGPIKGNIDTTLSYGTSTRLHRTDKDLVCTANGGTAYGCNADDGNLNYRTGTVSEVFKFTTDIELNHKTSDLGGFFRIKGFVDHENNNNNETGRTPLTDDAIDLVGKNVDILDAYVWKRVDINNQAAEVRFGKHVLNWGESTFIQGGINALNPIDVAAIRLPGSELREALLPVNMLSMSADLTDSISMEGFYQLEWDETSPDPSGSYFSTNDFGTDGGSRVQLGYGDFSDLGLAAGPFFTFTSLGTAAGVPAMAALDAVIGADIDVTMGVVGGHAHLNDNFFYGVGRGKDDTPSDDGQWGVSFKYFSEELNDTEFGVYYMNYHSRLPIVSAQTGTPTGQLAAGTAATLIAAPASATNTFLTAAPTSQPRDRS